MKKYFITGLVILLPLVLTVLVIGFLVNLLTQPFIGMVSSFLKHFNIINTGFFLLSPEQTLRYGSQFLILILLFLITMGLGMLARSLIINSIFRIGDKILHKIPLVKTVYKTTQDIINTLFISDKNSFKQVVLVPFPRKDVYVLGLVSRESPAVCSHAVHDQLISVLIPTTPNPTTGFLLMFKKEDLIFVDMKPEAAIKYIVSCGVIIPEEKSLFTPQKSS